MAIIQIQNLNKRYKSGFCSLRDINLNIQQGEIFALLGPNGAGKTTLINSICGLVRITSGRVLVGGYDCVTAYRQARQLIGLVPQELTVDIFDTPWQTTRFSRSLFGLPDNPAYIESLLKAVSLWDKKDSRMATLSGGMKRRVMIAKALSHEPRILFLDEPTAGVDVELRKDMWQQIKKLKSSGVTIILTTHYIEEAETMADRIGVINKGELSLVENKDTLLSKMGSKQIGILLEKPLNALPDELTPYGITLTGNRLLYTPTPDHNIALVLRILDKLAINYYDIDTQQESLEDIFVKLVKLA